MRAGNRRAPKGKAAKPHFMARARANVSQRAVCALIQFYVNLQRSELHRGSVSMRLSGCLI